MCCWFVLNESYGRGGGLGVGVVWSEMCVWIFGVWL